MIRMIPSTSAGHAKSYFSDALSKADYYLNDQELGGRFQGRLAERIGVAGPVNREAFFALCENRNPVTGERLTPRMKDKRIVGYDINFHCPKSVSILHVLSKDDHILKAFEAAVSETMHDMERDAKTRVRKDGVYDDRITGELLWADFTHQTARPVDGSLPDPHLHAHCFTFNATWDDAEKQIKAGKFRDIKRDMPYYEARFHKRLADRMVDLGYRIRATEKSFEIEGVPQVIIEHFSKRTDQIGRVAKEKGITDKKELDSLGARTRSRKQTGMRMQDLKNAWRYQIMALTAELDSDDPVRHAPRMEPDKNPADAGRCVDHALEHCFERVSVMNERRLIANAVRFALGQTHIPLDGIETLFKDDPRLIRLDTRGPVQCTTKEVLAEERRMVALARAGQGTMTPLYVLPPFVSRDLDDKQRAAAYSILTTRHQVMIVRGVAGSGKTTMMTEAVRLLRDAGKRVTVVAPTAQASRGVLKREGFKDATTVAAFLLDTKAHDKLKDQVLWVDEAGLLGTKDMLRLLELARTTNARLILGGDTRQHASVVRGDALRILSTVGGIRPAEVDTIHRQKNPYYKEAVAHLAKGDIAAGFAMLDKGGAVKTTDPLNPNDELVKAYLWTEAAGQTALVIAPTHEQGENITDAIRQKLREDGRIGRQEMEAVRYVGLNYTEAQKRDGRNYSYGHVIRFNQNRKHIKRGSHWMVTDVNGNTLVLYNDDTEPQTLYLDLDKPGSFDVYRKRFIGLSKNDTVRITRGGFDRNRKRLENGDVLQVARTTKTGRIVLRNAASKMQYIIDREFGHIAHGYCTTSHAAQGKTVDRVLISQPSSTFAATDAKQFYVSVSRGRLSATIYTDDREALLEAASETGDRQSAMELMKQRHTDLVLRMQREASQPGKEPIPEPSHPKPETIEYEHGPRV